MNWWQYLLLVNLYLILFYGFYALLLRRETFFQLNRLYLVASGILSFLIPMIQAEWVKNLFITQQVKSIIYNSPGVIINFRPVEEQPITIGQILIAVYIGGAVILTLKLIWQLIQLKRVINEPTVPAGYSFFNKIRLNEGLQNRDVIEAHEQVHSRQWHSLDILLIELLAVINWFNPVVSFYRKAIKHIHEYIADEQALNNGTDKSEYALLLVSQTFNAPTHQLVNSFFNHSLLKQRIMMLQKSKSNRVMLVKYCLSVPLFVLMLVLSSATVNKGVTLTVTQNAEKVFDQPAKDVVVTYTAKDNAGNVSSKKRTNLTVTLTQGQAAGLRVRESESDTTKKGDEVFTAVELQPDFPGGIDKFMNFIAKNIRYPREMWQNHIQGRVIVSFIVEKDGSLSNQKVLREPGHGAGEEALRVIKMSPRWKPGMQNGREVRVQFTVPINFTLVQGDQKGNGAKKDTTIKSGMYNSDGSQYKGGAGKYAVIDSGKKSIGLFDSSKSILGEPLFILDGVEISKKQLADVGPETIESISVLKDKKATDQFGYKGSNGVVIIKTKKAAVPVKRR